MSVIKLSINACDSHCADGAPLSLGVLQWGVEIVMATSSISCMHFGSTQLLRLRLCHSSRLNRAGPCLQLCCILILEQGQLKWRSDNIFCFCFCAHILSASFKDGEHLMSRDFFCEAPAPPPPPPTGAGNAALPGCIGPAKNPWVQAFCSGKVKGRTRTSPACAGLQLNNAVRACRWSSACPYEDTPVT